MSALRRETVAELAALDLDGWRALLHASPTVPLWPTAGVALSLSRPCAYRAAAAGQIRCLHLGRALRVPSTYLIEALGLDGLLPSSEDVRDDG